jgi:predicted O-methyltransferase YrrM
VRVISGFRQALQDPVDAYYKAIAMWHERNEPNAYCKAIAQWHERNEPGAPFCGYKISKDWRQQLGVSDGDHKLTDRLSQSIQATLTAKGLRPGPESYLWWNDGDPAFTQAIWCLIRRMHASKIVETGVAHGVTSRIILEALNGRGHLWSIDLPPPQSPELHGEIGAAVGSWPPEQWSLIFGPSRRRLPKLLEAIAPIDIFVHDSHHSKYNMLFEMARAWNALRPGGVLVVDDIDLNTAFEEFNQTVGGEKLIGEAEPIRPDTRRFNHKGLFGILFKPER